MRAMPRMLAATLAAPANEPTVRSAYFMSVIIGDLARASEVYIAWYPAHRYNPPALERAPEVMGLEGP
jgi:hypothetical protein